MTGLLEKAGLPAAQSQKLGQTIASNASSSYQQELYLLSGRWTGMPGMPGGGGMMIYSFGQSVQIPVGQMEQDAQRSAQVARQQLAGDVQAIDAYNAPILEANRRVRAGPLRGRRHRQGGQQAGLDDVARRPLRVRPRPPDGIHRPDHRHRAGPPVLSTPGGAPTFQQQLVGVQHHSCFGAGTPVRTLDGLRPIETLRLGDQVLTQNPRSGELKYQAVVAVYHNPPNATVRMAMEGGESIVATGIHRLWKAGKGWTMARELKPGDVLRTLGGLASVKSVEADRTQLVYNLQVADGESYFVGTSGVLAHDNSTINPVPEPFDAVGTLSTSPAAKPRSMLGR